MEADGPILLDHARTLFRRYAAELAGSIAESLCFQVKLSDTAPSSLQGKSASATFTATGTSDIS